MLKMVFSGLVMAWRLATWPTRRSPFLLMATTEGVMRRCVPAVAGHRARERLGGLTEHAKVRMGQTEPVPGIGVTRLGGAEPLQESPGFLPAPSMERGTGGGFQGLRALLVDG